MPLRSYTSCPTASKLVRHIRSSPQNRIRTQALTLLLDEVRRGALTENLALQGHEQLTALKMRLLGDRVSRRTAWKVARKQGWERRNEAECLAPSYKRTRWSRSTTRFQRRAEGIVPLAPVEALTADQPMTRCGRACYLLPRRIRHATAGQHERHAA